MPIFPSRIVGHDHLVKVNDAITKIDEALHEAKLLDQAGLGGIEHIEKLKVMKDKMLRLKSVYFPGH